jgi:hypothetical protein
MAAEVLNVPPATLEIKPQVKQKSLVSRPAFGFIISGVRQNISDAS